MAIRRAFLWSMIVSLSLAALLGVAALVFGSNSSVMEKIFVTTLLWGGFSIICLMHAVAIERRRLAPQMWVGIGCAVTAFVIWEVLIWANAFFWDDGETLARVGGTFSLIAVPLAPAGLIALPRLRVRWTRVLRHMTYLCLALFSVLIIFMMWAEEWFDWQAEEVMWRAVGVFGILSGAGIILVPVFWKLQGLEEREQGSMPSRLAIHLTCPRCGRQQAISAGAGKCQACGLRINIDIEEPRCACGYLLFNLTGDRCPECGRQIPEGDRWAAQAQAIPPVVSHGD